MSCTEIAGHGELIFHRGWQALLYFLAISDCTQNQIPIKWTGSKPICSMAEQTQTLKLGLAKMASHKAQILLNSPKTPPPIVWPTVRNQRPNSTLITVVSS